MSVFIKPVTKPSTKEVKRVLYRDVNLGDDLNSGLDNVNELAIMSSLRNILTTKKGSRVLRPLFGSTLDQFLFEPITEENGILVLAELDKVLVQEPRISVYGKSVFVDKPNSTYNITIAYMIPTLKTYYTSEITLGGSGVSMTAKKIYNNN